MRLHWYLSKCSFPCHPQMSKKSSKLRKGSAQFPQTLMELFIQVHRQVPSHWDSIKRTFPRLWRLLQPPITGWACSLSVANGKEKRAVQTSSSVRNSGWWEILPQLPFGKRKGNILFTRHMRNPRELHMSFKAVKKGGRPCVLTEHVAAVQSPLCPWKKEADLLWESREYRGGPRCSC